MSTCEPCPMVNRAFSCLFCSQGGWVGGWDTRSSQCLHPNQSGCHWRDGQGDLETFPICQRGLDLAADPSRGAWPLRQAVSRRAENFHSISICLFSFLGVTLSRHGFWSVWKRPGYFRTPGNEPEDEAVQLSSGHLTTPRRGGGREVALWSLSWPKKGRVGNASSPLWICRDPFACLI